MRPPDTDADYPTYEVRVCTSCDRLEPVDRAVERLDNAGAACGRDGCEGQLIEIEVIASSIAEGWRRDLASGDERVERINADLAGVLMSGETAQAHPASQNGLGSN